LNPKPAQLLVVAGSVAAGLVVYCGLALLARPIVSLLFEWRGGEFDAMSTVQTARGLMFYAPGLLVFGLYKVLVPVFYAFQDTRRPVRVALWVVGLNLLLNVTFILTWPRGFKHAGLAFATVLASAVNCLILGVMLHRKLGSPGWSRIAKSAARTLVASLVMGITVFLASKLLASGAMLAGLNPKPAQLLVVAGSVAAGLVVYCGLALLLCREEIRAVLTGRD